jgi:hypothetical protein
VHEARTKLEAGEAVAFDVVQPGVWDGLDGVIEGAIRIPPDEILERFEELPRDRTSSPTAPDQTRRRAPVWRSSCETTATGLGRLTGGYWAGRDAGYPIESKAAEMARGTDALCPECVRPWGDHVAAS